MAGKDIFEPPFLRIYLSQSFREINPKIVLEWMESNTGWNFTAIEAGALANALTEVVAIANEQ